MYKEVVRKDIKKLIDAAFDKAQADRAARDKAIADDRNANDERKREEPAAEADVDGESKRIKSDETSLAPVYGPDELSALNSRLASATFQDKLFDASQRGYEMRKASAQPGVALAAQYNQLTSVKTGLGELHSADLAVAHSEYTLTNEDTDPNDLALEAPQRSAPQTMDKPSRTDVRMG